jgi:hypothetical protein
VKKALTLLALSLSLAPAAHAGLFTYSYNGSGSGPPASSLTGSFQVDQAAIASGTITLADFQNVSFTLAVRGYADLSFTSIASITGNGGVIAVDAQGMPTSENVLDFPRVNNPYGARGVLTAEVDFNLVNTFPTDGYSAVYAADPGIVFNVFGGSFGDNWAVVPGPATVPSSLALLAIGSLGLAVWRRRAAG